MFRPRHKNSTTCVVCARSTLSRHIAHRPYTKSQFGDRRYSRLQWFEKDNVFFKSRATRVVTKFHVPHHKIPVYSYHVITGLPTWWGWGPPWPWYISCLQTLRYYILHGHDLKYLNSLGLRTHTLSSSYHLPHVNLSCDSTALDKYAEPCKDTLTHWSVRWPCHPHLVDGNVLALWPTVTK